eukprot:c11594_g1_i3.p1 GENE.c11594_g1_i3~~c11594_g1_i3.p1  ORF type:complete len:213 (+),score=42.36 c11594_g1_i3:34-672(+)
MLARGRHFVLRASCPLHRFISDSNQTQRQQTEETNDDDQTRATIDRLVRVAHVTEWTRSMASKGHSTLGSATKDQYSKYDESNLNSLETTMMDLRVRPSFCLPGVTVTAFAIGAASNVLGDSFSRACATAMQNAVVAEYNSLIREMNDTLVAEPKLRETLRKLRDTAEDEVLALSKSQSNTNAPSDTPLVGEVPERLVKLAFGTMTWLVQKI